MALIPEKVKESARALLLKGGMSNADIARQTGISEMSVWKLKKDLAAAANNNGSNGHGGAEGGEGGAGEGEEAPPKRMTVKDLEERTTQLEFELSLEKLKNKWLRGYAKAGTDSDAQKDAEIGYLRARLALFGDEWVRPLADEQEEE